MALATSWYLAVAMRSCAICLFVAAETLSADVLRIIDGVPMKRAQSAKRIRQTRKVFMVSSLLNRPCRTRRLACWPRVLHLARVLRGLVFFASLTHARIA